MFVFGGPRAKTVELLSLFTSYVSVRFTANRLKSQTAAANGSECHLMDLVEPNLTISSEKAGTCLYLGVLEPKLLSYYPFLLHT